MKDWKAYLFMFSLGTIGTILSAVTILPLVPPLGVLTTIGAWPLAMGITNKIFNKD